MFDTFNEVRAKLGLAPVAWGERPTSPVDARSNPSTSGSATGEANHEKEKEDEKKRLYRVEK